MSDITVLMPDMGYVGYDVPESVGVVCPQRHAQPYLVVEVECGRPREGRTAQG